MTAYHGWTHKPGGTDPISNLRADMPWIYLLGNLNGFTAVNGSDSYPNLTGLHVSPESGGGSVDPNVFGGIDTGGGQVDVMTAGSSNEPFKAIEILQPGLYLYAFEVAWYLNWGAVRVNYDVTHSDAFQSVINMRQFLNGAGNSYFGGVTDASAPQIHLSAWSLLSVDERATDVQVRGFVHNHSGANRTYGTTSGVDTGEATLYIVQLSASGHSNP